MATTAAAATATTQEHEKSAGPATEDETDAGTTGGAELATADAGYAAQYDVMQEAWTWIRASTVSRLEREAVRHLLRDCVQGARALDLACGQGHYTLDLVRWGARAALGVDLSQEMVGSAWRRLARVQREEQRVDWSGVRFVLADVARAQPFPGAPFDLVFGAWPLEYAPDRASLVAMWRSVARNLRRGGRFPSCGRPRSSRANWSRGRTASDRRATAACTCSGCGRRARAWATSSACMAKRQANSRSPSSPSSGARPCMRPRRARLDSLVP